MKTAFNLLPDEYASEHRRTVRRERLFAVLLTAAAVVIGQYFLFGYRRLSYLQERYEAAAGRYRAEAERLAELNARWAKLSLAGRRWTELEAAADGSLPALELLVKSFVALPAGGKLVQVIADEQRCRVDMLLPEGVDVLRIIRKLGRLRGYSAFSSGGRNSGRQGLPVFRFDAVRESGK